MRIGANARIDVANLAWASVFPTSVAGNVLWLRADAGVTLSSASVSNDTAATWSLQNATRATGQTDPVGGTSAIKLTDSLDGAPTIHDAFNALTNLQAGPAMFDFWAAPGTQSWIGFAVGAGVSGFYNLATDATSGLAAGTTIELLASVGIWRKLRVRGTNTGGANCFLYSANSTPANNYTGDGTGTLFIGTGATYGPRLYQDRVSAWADQSGQANNATQGTAANQPLYQELDGSGLWVPTATTGTTKRIGWLADAAKVFGMPAGLASPFSGTNKPVTAIAIVARQTNMAATNANGVHLTGAGTQTFAPGPYRVAGASGQKMIASWVDDTPTTKEALSALVATSGQLGSQATVSDGDLASLYLNGVADVGNPFNVDLGAITLTAANMYFRGHRIAEYAVFSSALSDPDRKRVENGMRARWGLNPL